MTAWQRPLLCWPLVLALVGCSAPSDGDQASDAQEPAAGATSAAESLTSLEPPVVRSADFTVTYRLDGQTADSEVVTLLPSSRLELEAAVPAGTRVSSGLGLGQVVVGEAARAELEAAAATSRISAAALAQLETFTGPLESPVAGVLDDGPLGPVVASPGVDVVVDLTPLQALRYRSLPFSGQVTVESVIGQRTVACSAVWAERLPEATAAGSTDRLHCRVPSFVETVSGLRASLVLASRTIPAATVVPNLALRYDSSVDGYTVVIDKNGSELAVPVEVGATDGVVRVVTGDLPDGAAIVLPDGAAAP